MTEQAKNASVAQELAERFRELARLFQKHTPHSDEPLSALKGYVDEDLPWQAGSYLCEAFDLGILDSRSPQGASVGCDLRFMSPLWCRDRLKAKGQPPLKPRPKTNPNAILDGETAEGVQLLAKRCEEYPQDLRRWVDKQVRIESWWRFITKRLAEDDRSRIRLGITLDDHKPLLEIFDGKSKKFEPDASNPEERFCGETSEAKVRYRLRKSARIQEVACERLAEMLDSYSAVESSETETPGSNLDTMPEPPVRLKACQQAFICHQWACEKMGVDHTTTKDEESWNYLNNEGMPSDEDGLPGITIQDVWELSTFRQYCSKARKETGEGKYHPRQSGVTTRSVKKLDEL